MLDRLQEIHPLLPTVVALLVLVTVALAADAILKRVIGSLVSAFIQRTKFAWDDVLMQHNVFGRVAQAIPAVIIAAGIRFVPGASPSVIRLVTSVSTAFVVLMLTLAISAALRAGNRIYESYPVARERPLRGFVEVLQIVVYILGGVIIVATLLDRSPLLLLSGFGAMTAVLLLVFKDTILGLVASVQLASNDMVRVGDWIEMPQLGADGDVIEVALHTVKVQNWDKTITSIPTHKLIEMSFKNWRGMSESGGRRIKRPIHIDQSSIRFLTNDEVAHLRKFSLLSPYIDDKLRELEAYHARIGEAAAANVNRRRLTNVGTFRAYVRQYLRNHPGINQDLTLLVRQLQPGPEGLPIELYCFTRSTAWAVYEDLQSDIFDHVISILPEFHLRLFQSPSGADITSLVSRRTSVTDNEALKKVGTVSV
jgi:miniconductance mechanosensitive channel